MSNLVNISREAHNYKPLSVSVFLQFCFEHINNYHLREENLAYIIIIRDKK